MKPRDPCYCDSKYDFPHRHADYCYEYVSREEYYNECDPPDDQERRLDERDRAADMNAEFNSVRR
jgi:hypothetical protein